jgi:tRNA(fMet)-specific endonuclease VapC
MSLRYLLDTNIVSEPLRPEPQPLVLEKLRQNQDALAISAITWHELWFGCQRLPASVRRSAIEKYLVEVIAPSMPILSYDEAAAEWHAHQRARLVAAGSVLPYVVLITSMREA